MSLIHLEILDEARKTVLTNLKFLQREARLGGGTALALQIVHRQSYDFDLFFDREINRDHLLKLQKHFGVEKVILNTSNQISVITKSSVNITLLYYPFHAIFNPVITEYIDVLSIKDIAFDKAYTIGRRAVWRDYVDIFFILKNNYISLEEIINNHKFGVEFNPKLFLEQLIYFDDITITPITYIKDEITPDEIKRFLFSKVKSCKNAIITGKTTY